MDRGEEAEGMHMLHLDSLNCSIPRLTGPPKKTFIVATLASTLVGTFTASMGLWERVSDRREQHKQKQRDTKQDDEIKELRKQFEESQKSAEGRQREIERLKNGGGSDDGRRDGGRGGGRRRDEVGSNLERDSYMIQRMYDDMYGRYGGKFAQGDGMFNMWDVKEHALTISQLSSRISSKHKSYLSSRLSSTSFKTLSPTTAN